MRLVGDVEDDDATIDIGRIGAVGPLGVDVDVMRAEAGIELRMTHRFGGGDAMLPTAMVGVSLAAAGYSSGGACP